HVLLRHLHELGRPVGHELIQADAFDRAGLVGSHSFSTSALSLSSSGLIENRVNLDAWSSSSMFTMLSNSASRSMFTTMILSAFPREGASTFLRSDPVDLAHGAVDAPSCQYSRPSAST